MRYYIIPHNHILILFIVIQHKLKVSTNKLIERGNQTKLSHRESDNPIVMTEIT